jgi:hypothetical protein
MRGELSNEELAAQFLALSEQDVSGKQMVSLNETDPLSELLGDRDRFRHEIQDQLTRRMKKYFLQKERQKSDYVKPRVNEGIAFEEQKFTTQNMMDSLQAQVDKTD